jgi:hypothetical protein
MGDFKELSKYFSLIPLNGKKPIEKNWQKWCKSRRLFNSQDFPDGCNAGVCCGPASRILVLDIDDNRLFRTARKQNCLKLAVTYKIQTGGGGFHYYFRYPDDGKKYGNKRKKDWGFDIRGDGGQVVAEGSVHPDTGKLYCRVINGCGPDEIVAAPDWLLALYEEKPPKAEGGKEWDGEVDTLPITQRVKNLIINEKPVGERSEAEITVLNALVGAGLSDQSIDQIFDHNPIGDRTREKGSSHLQVQISKAREYASPDPKKETNVDHGDIIEDIACTSTVFLARNDLQPPSILIKPILRAQSLSMIFAPAGIGKSWLVHTLALGLTRIEYTEVEIGPWQIKRPCGVLLVDGEMPAGLLRERIKALSIPMGPEDQKNPFLVFTAEEVAAKLGLQVNLAKEEWRDNITNFLHRRSEIRLLILDNISSLVPGGDENTKGSWDPVNQWLLSLRRQGVAVILVHHAGKGGNYRGHSGRIDNLDNVIQLVPKGGADEVKFEIRLSKARCLRPGEGVPFGLELVEWDEDPNCMIWIELNLAQDRKREIQAALLRGDQLKKDIAKDFGITPGRVSQYISDLKQQSFLDSKGKITRKGIDFLQDLKVEEKDQEEL